MKILSRPAQQIACTSSSDSRCAVTVKEREWFLPFYFPCIRLVVDAILESRAVYCTPERTQHPDTSMRKPITRVRFSAVLSQDTSVCR